jgi:hypothetical protein
MKLLLDEHIDWRLKELFEPHEVFTIGDMEWLGKQNGELMTLIGEYEFDIFITIDKNIPYQQNLKNLKSALWVIDTPSSKRDYVALFIPMILEEIDNIPEDTKPEKVLKYIILEGLSPKKKILK